MIKNDIIKNGINKVKMEFLTSTKCDNAFDEEEEYEVEYVHLWLRQRGGRKCIKEVNGLASDLNLKKIMKYWKIEFHVSVSKIFNDKGEKFIRLQGDQRDNVFRFLINEKIIQKEYIKIHGF